jgi:hypothetical protein
MPARRIPRRSGHPQNVPVGPDSAGSKVPAPIAAAAVPVGTDLGQEGDPRCRMRGGSARGHHARGRTGADDREGYGRRAEPVGGHAQPMFAPHQLLKVRWICGSSLAKTSGRTAAGGLEGSGWRRAHRRQPEHDQVKPGTLPASDSREVSKPAKIESRDWARSISGLIVPPSRLATAADRAEPSAVGHLTVALGALVRWARFIRIGREPARDGWHRAPTRFCRDAGFRFASRAHLGCRAGDFRSLGSGRH